MTNEVEDPARRGRGLKVTARERLLGIRALLLALVAWTGVQALVARTDLEGRRPDPPEVSKVEPPSWWAGHSLNPLRLMLRGRNLGGARVESSDPALRVDGLQVSASGTTLFVDVRIDPDAPPGARRLRVVTPGGEAEARLELLRPLPRTGRFRGFSPDDVIYLIMPDRFANGDPANDDPPRSRGLLDRGKRRYYHGGDLQGVIDRLPYLQDVGVTTLWLNPIYDNLDRLTQRYDKEGVTDYHGYGAVDFYAVEEHFGDLPKLRELVEAAHRLGLKVIQDQVANHTGPFHPWVSDPPTPTWFNGTEARHLANTWQIWTLMDPHAAPALRKATLEGWFADILPDLNQDDEEVARYIIQNTLWWMGVAGLDGIRQDTLPYVPRRFWREWMAAIKREYPSLTVVGELWDGDPALVAFYQSGATRFDGIDARIDTLFDFPLYYPIRRAFAEAKPIKELAVMLAHDHLYPDPSMLVTFLGNHDVPRFMSEPGATVEGLKLAFTFLMTARGIPLIYYGDEIGMRGGGDPDNRRDFPGGWPGDPRSAFLPAGRTPDEQSVFDHVRRLTRLRAELPALRRGSMVSLAATDRTFAFARISDAGSAVAVFNNDTAAATVAIDAEPARLPEGALLYDRLGVSDPVRARDGKIELVLPPRSAALYAHLTSGRERMPEASSHVTEADGNADGENHETNRALARPTDRLCALSDGARQERHLVSRRRGRDTHSACRQHPWLQRVAAALYPEHAPHRSRRNLLGLGVGDGLRGRDDGRRHRTQDSQRCGRPIGLRGTRDQGRRAVEDDPRVRRGARAFDRRRLEQLGAVGDACRLLRARERSQEGTRHIPATAEAALR